MRQNERRSSRCEKRTRNWNYKYIPNTEKLRNRSDLRELIPNVLLEGDLDSSAERVALDESPRSLRDVVVPSFAPIFPVAAAR